MVTAVFAGRAEGQTLRRDGGSATRKVDSILPSSGPPGSEIVIKSGSMPAITPIRLGFGATTGFEELEMLLTSENGEFVTRAFVPWWASWEKSYRFIVFDVYFRPIALSEPFFATNGQGMIYREGSVSRENAECVTLREVNGDVHHLVGEVALLKAGERTGIEGTLVGPSRCLTGVTIRVTRVRTR